METIHYFSWLHAPPLHLLATEWKWLNYEGCAWRLIAFLVWLRSFFTQRFMWKTSENGAAKKIWINGWNWTGIDIQTHNWLTNAC